MSRRWIGVCALALGAAIALWPRTPRADERNALAAIRRPVEAGDMVLFRTTTWRGRLVSALQDDSGNFTHAGIVVDAAPRAVRVAHASPTEPAIVRIDPLSDLLARDEITSVAIYKPRVRPDAAVRAAKIASGYARRKTPFDYEFELADDRAVYCTELVWLSYRAAGLKIGNPHDILFPADLAHARFFEPLANAERAVPSTTRRRPS